MCRMCASLSSTYYGPSIINVLLSLSVARGLLHPKPNSILLLEPPSKNPSNTSGVAGSNLCKIVSINNCLPCYVRLFY